MQVKAEGQTSQSSDVEGRSKRPAQGTGTIAVQRSRSSNEAMMKCYCTDTNRGLSFQL